MEPWAPQKPTDPWLGPPVERLEYRIRVPDFLSVVYFSRGTSSKKGDLVGDRAVFELTIPSEKVCPSKGGGIPDHRSGLKPIVGSTSLFGEVFRYVSKYSAPPKTPWNDDSPLNTLLSHGAGVRVLLVSLENHP